ncbi:transporter substrate-binding domain-containing protein [Aliagarivorans taiwanensis]|uniref:transporter substrate-binding domain-containing protein n=1 Tax=Aliagarivorans taiwanensis TaxID=561966 RepID=UPI0003FF8CBD|nr:transporter substrate-binding domain-containing protein [Aliagarivorans taiwanensis]
MMRLFKILLFCWLSNAALAADETPIRFVTEASYPPFEYFEQQDLRGFDIELAELLCRQINRKCEFYHQPFDSLLHSVLNGHYDAAISALDITEERQLLVDFSDAYFDNSAVFVVPKVEGVAVDIVDGSVIAVQSGSSLQEFIQEQRPELFAIAYPSYQAALDDLAKNRIDGVFIDKAAAMYWLNKYTHLAARPKDHSLGSGLGIAVSKDNQELLNLLNHALSVVKNNGSYRQLYQEYFEAEP